MSLLLKEHNVFRKLTLSSSLSCLQLIMPVELLRIMGNDGRGSTHGEPVQRAGALLTRFLNNSQCTAVAHMSYQHNSTAAQATAALRLAA